MTPLRLRTLLILAMVAFNSSPVLQAGDSEREKLAQLLPRIEAPAVAFFKGAENARLRVLIAVDTDDQAGITWGRDGLNVKAMLESMLKKQGLADRSTIDIFTGKQVTADKILTYYRTLKVEAGDALLFYYSGHGGFHLKKGHFLALTHGKLDRNDLLDAMAASHPRLCVVLTDCCSNYAGGALAAEPKGAIEQPSTHAPSPVTAPAKREEPKVSHMVARVPNPKRFLAPPRPKLPLGTFPKAKQQEPVGYVFPANRPMPRNLKLAKNEEPLITTVLPPNAGLPTLTTHQGKIPMGDILDASDGAVLRDLFFRHAGVVDINGCTKGDLSYGTIQWGGSLFTNSLIALQKAKAADYDKNGNRVVEWNEFFPSLQSSTNDVGGRIPGQRVRQVPEATKLGTPVLP